MRGRKSLRSKPSHVGSRERQGVLQERSKSIDNQQNSVMIRRQSVKHCRKATKLSEWYIYTTAKSMNNKSIFFL